MTDLDIYLDDVKARPLVIEPTYPRWGLPLSILGGLCVGGALGSLIDADPWPWWSWLVLAAGLICDLAWFFGAASEGAFARRYEKARIRAIHQRYRDLGLPLPGNRR